jgi:hypothetical protein
VESVAGYRAGTAAAEDAVPVEIAADIEAILALVAGDTDT